GCRRLRRRRKSAARNQPPLAVATRHGSPCRSGPHAARAGRGKRPSLRSQPFYRCPSASISFKCGLRKSVSSAILWMRPSYHQPIMKFTLRTIFSLALASVAAVAIPAQQSAVSRYIKVPAGVIVLQHVRVIDGTGADPLEDQTITL